MKDYIHFTGLHKIKSTISVNKEETASDNLYGILNKGFKFSTNKVFTPRRKDKTNGCEMKIEMICFSEMHISDIKANHKKYGKFAIGMNLDWIKKYSGQPVLYSFGKSTSNYLLNEIEDMLVETFNIYLENSDERLNAISLRLADLTNLVQAVTEPYNHKFENEWRITNYPRNEIVKRDLKHKDENHSAYLEFYDEDINFIIFPKIYFSKFENLIETKGINKNKIIFFEDII